MNHAFLPLPPFAITTPPLYVPTILDTESLRACLDVSPSVCDNDAHARLVDEILGREHLTVLVVLRQRRQGVVLLSPHHQLRFAK